MKKLIMSFAMFMILTGCTFSITDVDNTPTKKVEAYLNNYQSLTEDVLSDLDITRCKNILMYLEKGGQTFITVAEIGKVELTKNYKLYEIDNNEIVRRR